MLVRLQQTPEKPFRASKPPRLSLSSEFNNYPSSRDLGIFISRSSGSDSSGPAYFIAKIMPDGLVKRFVNQNLKSYHDSNKIFLF